MLRNVKNHLAFTQGKIIKFGTLGHNATNGLNKNTKYTSFPRYDELLSKTNATGLGNRVFSENLSDIFVLWKRE
jgi:hypothetical protein